MRLRNIIPFLLLVLACTSPAARAGGTHDGHGVHAHIHSHGASTHLHTHTEKHNDHEHSPCEFVCDDGTHPDCCEHHHHHPEQVGEGLNTRNRDLPTFTAGIVSALPDFFRLASCEALLRWAPLRQRPPDYLRAFRTCVMLN